MRPDTDSPGTGAARAAAVGVPSPRAVYDAALRTPGSPLLARRNGQWRALRVDRWLGPASDADESLLSRCRGPALDVGCGPGRLAAALAARGITVLGIDIAPFAVVLARQSGASALCRDVFGPLPGAGRWRETLLVDGNIGIGGDPGRLLRRIALLLAPDGTVLVELDPPGAPTGSYWTRLAVAGLVSAPLRWAGVGVDGIAGLAAVSGFEVAETWQSAGRHFARLLSSTRLSSSCKEP
ncbi:SAM-dependent methyltransferase [Frankia sp. CcI49]|uniref:methyltransferase domain-containing protein n=1 Tax=unclassified Frankia TaxID=2632575 RepID=UPI0006CA5174|nr:MULTISPECIES: methyltransferase domain-containing protein [unclassified Frankia]ONH51692.1 SAM-dependent methyltransferase [Frankia sp. CcI49]